MIGHFRIGSILFYFNFSHVDVFATVNLLRADIHLYGPALAVLPVRSFGCARGTPDPVFPFLLVPTLGYGISLTVARVVH